MHEDASAPTPRLTPRLVFGLIIMGLGALFTLDNLGLMRAGDILRFWPIALIAIGLVRFIQPCRGESTLAPVAWMVGGCALLAHNLGWLSIGKLWPLVLLFVGAGMVTRAVRRSGSHPTGGGDGASRDYIRGGAFMGGVSRTSSSPTFRGGEAIAIMGGVEVDLRQAGMEAEEVVFDCLAIWGGIEIFVPDQWEVVNRGVAFMAGFEDKTCHPAVPRGRLVVTGFTVMGAVEIKN
jgi:hypothetical protein